MDKGTDIQSLLKNTGQKDFTFILDDLEWTFKMKEISWGDHFSIIENCWELIQNHDLEWERKFNTARYYEDILMTTIMELPDGTGPTRQILRQFSTPVISQLILSDCVPGPLLEDITAEVKKE